MLVVDDEEAITAALQHYFTQNGFSVDSATTCEDALSLIAAHRYSVVIADLRLSGTTGEEGLTVVAAARARNAAAAVVLLTAYRTAEIERHAYEAGASVLLQKPRPLQELDRTLRSLLEREIPNPHQEADSMRKKVLLVDDSATILMMERMILAKLPIDLITATNGHEAIEKAAAEHPDLILMDVVMPRMNGLEACRSIREQAQSRNTPIIMVTTRGEMENIESAFASGCTDYVTKPINSAELVAKMRNYLEQNGSLS